MIMITCTYVFHDSLQVKMTLPAAVLILFHLMLRSDDYRHVKGLLPAQMCSVTLVSSEQCLLVERFHLHHVQIVNKTYPVSKQN